MRARWSCVTALLWMVAVAAPGAGARDRLEDFQEIIGRARGSASNTDAAAISALVDEEILENLASGGVFASDGFIQERLDAFTAVWGGARFGVRRLLSTPRLGSSRRATLIALYSLDSVDGRGGWGSIRVFGSGEDGAVLLRSITHEGAPEVHEWPPAAEGDLQFAASWVGPDPGHGGRLFRVEVWRRHATGLSRVWSTAEALPDGLVASEVRIARGQIVMRYQARYPGWKPGCTGQTEHADQYRVGPAADEVRLVGRQVVNGWHRELGQAVTRFFDALGRGDSRAVAELVPDALVRARIPRELVAEPACDARVEESPETVVVSATEEREHRYRPWALRWRRMTAGWRLTGATPVLE